MTEYDKTECIKFQRHSKLPYPLRLNNLFKIGPNDLDFF